MSKKGHKTTDAPSREQKKAEFQAGGNTTLTKRRQLTLVGVIVVLCVVAIYVIWGGGRSESALKGGQQAIGTPGQDVQIPLSEVSDGKARFYNYRLASNQEISFFVVKSSDGVIRAAFNACDVCYEKRLGYHQQGDDMVCRNCGKHFPSGSVNEVQGGCNPAPLKRVVEGDHLVIRASDLQQGGFYF